MSFKTREDLHFIDKDGKNKTRIQKWLGLSLIIKKIASEKILSKFGLYVTLFETIQIKIV